MFVLTVMADGYANIHTHENGVCQPDNVIAQWDDADRDKEAIAAEWTAVGTPIMDIGPNGLPYLQTEVVRNT